MRAKSLSDTGLLFDVGETCEPSLLPTPRVYFANARGKAAIDHCMKSGPATSSAAGSHASRYLLPAGVRLNVIRAGSGRISRECFAYYDLATRCWKTSQACLWPDMECLESSLTLPKWGIAVNGRLYRRVPLVRPISGRGCSLLPTPAANPPNVDGTELVDKDGNPPEHWNQRLYDRRTGRLAQKGLEQILHLLPTPNSMDGKGINLAQAAKLLPTATATAHKRGYSNQAERGLLCPSHAGGPINPEWLEHLMGFPIGWTALKE